MHNHTSRSVIDSIDKGLLKMIQHKLEAGSTIEHIEKILVDAGFSTSEIVEAIKVATKQDKDAHRRKVEQNDFLPPLKKVAQREVQNSPLKVDLNPVEEVIHAVDAEIKHKGLFRGRLRRKDFIMGTLFFFGLGYIYMTIAVTLMQSLLPGVWDKIITFIENDSYGVWLIFIPFIFAPITIVMLSLITRRLHNIGLPGWFSLLYLLAFISPFGDLGSYSLLGLHIALFVLFIVLLTKKGDPQINRHGALPESEGSIFAKIMGRDHH